MKNWKTFFFAIISVGLMAACSSAEEDTTPTGGEENNEQWQSISLAVGVHEGKADNADANTRAQGELDPNTELPTAHYADKLPIYLCKYDAEKSDISESLIIRNENTSANGMVTYEYLLDGANNQVIFKAYGQTISVRIQEYDGQESPAVDGGNDRQLFFFSSTNQMKNVHFPSLEEGWGPYDAGKTCVEFGDRLFCTDGYFFQWKDEGHTRAGLYYIIRNHYEGVEVKEVKEIPSWRDANWDLTMIRMTACISVRLMLIDSFSSDGKIKNIEGIVSPWDGGSQTEKKDGIELTNAALQKYLDAPENIDKWNRIDPRVVKEMKNFNVENICVVKKAFENFPCIFDWENGLQATNAAARKDLLICNRDDAAWIDEMTFYEHGSSKIAALTATCDNEPFIPADGKFTYAVDLVLYMGIGNQAEDRCDKVIQYIIPFGTNTTGSNQYHVTPNTHTYIYVGITLENIVELYYNLFLRDTPLTRSGEIPSIELSSDQIMTFSEPYRSSEN